MSDKLKFRSSGFAILDVTKGRKKLAKHFASAPPLGECPQHLRLPIIVHGYISGTHGRDDGVSQEFSLIVTGIEQGNE